jgi:hypothetical protein
MRHHRSSESDTSRRLPAIRTPLNANAASVTHRPAMRRSRHESLSLAPFLLTRTRAKRNVHKVLMSVLPSIARAGRRFNSGAWRSCKTDCDILRIRFQV